MPVRPKPDFTLRTTEGIPFDFRAETRGVATLLYFGYTNCPDACPAHLANIATVLRRMPRDQQDRLRVVFVTTDPQRDTPQALRSWLDNFDKRFIGLRGGQDELNGIQSALGLPSARMEMPDSNRPGPRAYGVSHAAQVLAFTADDSLRYEYPFGVTQSTWANDLPRLIAWPSPAPR